MQKFAACLCFLLIFTHSAFAQELPTQTIRGTVLDKDSKSPLVGVTVFISTLNPPKSTATDENGEYKLENVPVGRHTVQAEYMGYSGFMSENVILGSAKELILAIELTENAFTTKEVVVTDTVKQQMRTLNEMTVVSGRSFSAEETQRYAGAINDPSRMAMGFAGVRPNQDNNSDIVVRGNSPVGVLWRLEGIDIPNPNHFARPGSSGGGISIFSAALLANSDFSTGAFAPEYGNAFASVFDMRFRKGNNEKREFTLKAGIIGLDFSTEGYFKKGGASYLVNYRYSTLGILNKLGVHLVGERVNNTFQDLSFNLAFPSANKKHLLTWFGMGGLSGELTRAVSDTNDWKQYSDYLKTDFITNMGATGFTHTYTVNTKGYIKTAAALMSSKVIVRDDTLNRAKNASNVLDELFTEGRLTLTSAYNHKFSPRLTLKTGVFLNHLFFTYLQTEYNRNTRNRDTIVNGGGSTQMLQGYAQVKGKITKWLSVVGGVHSLFLVLNKTYTVEPRLAFQAQLGKGHSLSLGYGLHGRILPLGSYFTTVINSNREANFVNTNLRPIMAHHLVLGYDWYAPKGWHMRGEAYYQSLYNVPVGLSQGGNFWLLNERLGYAKEKLYSTGKGLNYGLDITLEKFFSKQFFVLISGSYYRSTATGINGNTFSTRYDGLYNTSYMGGKEFTFKKGGTLQLGLRGTYSGGLRYTPADSALSRQNQALVLDNTQPYRLQVPAYFRIDGRIAYRKNLKKFNYTIALDVQNATAYKNVRNQIYDYIAGQLVYSYQSGLVPVLSFQIDF